MKTNIIISLNEEVMHKAFGEYSEDYISNAKVIVEKYLSASSEMLAQRGTAEQMLVGLAEGFMNSLRDCVEVIEKLEKFTETDEEDAELSLKRFSALKLIENLKDILGNNKIHEGLKK